MEPLDPIVKIIALTMGAAWASGINLYAAILVLGILGMTGNVVLPPNLQILASPIVVVAAGLMYLVEFVADKIPGVDTGWDTVQTFVRIPLGALLAAGAVGEVNPPLALAAAIAGGGLAAGTHAAKSGARVMINTSPEPFSNWIVSLLEDLAVVAGLWTALYHPWVFLGLLTVFILLLIWLLPKLLRGVKTIFNYFRQLFRRNPMDPLPPKDPGNPRI
jgi:hypothetical protein